MDALNKEVYRSLSGDEVLDIADGKAKLIVYEDLKNFRTLDELLSPHASVVILYEWERENDSSYGHYVAVNRVKDSIEHFDSLMFLPDRELGLVPENIKKGTRQDHTYLTRLYSASGYPISYNHHKLQADDTATCGRWAGLRCRMKNIDLDVFANYFLNNGVMSPDQLVTILTHAPEQKKRVHFKY